ncbi:ABATE domain-containing protein [Streptomyces sp. RKAG293]|uniref:CGNR zinc finger domain-containing protein n=1 Tax=Streptomyces sp. RKAG293 TaxID=2893403 RepID=UPI0020343E2F|nr:ABATE domain-containing protein [Streptomyces sp. RKAG293]MCM2422717.1 ABATE domain-containing protein [Streptomyces sp. RKAG293]
MKVEDLEGGGAPALGEPLPIELANATYAVRGRLVDGLQSVEHVAAWFRDNRGRFAEQCGDADLLAAGPEELRATRALRDAIRVLAEAAVCGRTPPRQAVEVINRQVRAAARWRELSWADGPSVRARSATTSVTAALADIAQRAVDFFGGDRIGDLRACQAPGCVLYFVKDHPRREWCSAGCGTRARAARHYERTKAAR